MQQPLEAGQLRHFALATSAALVAVFGLLLPWLFGFAWPIWPWVVGGGLAVWGLCHPRSLAPVHSAWMKLAEILHRVMTPFVLSVVFFLLLVPVGLFMKRIGRDTMRRRPFRADSYRVPTDRDVKRSMENPF